MHKYVTYDSQKRVVSKCNTCRRIINMYQSRRIYALFMTVIYCNVCMSLLLLLLNENGMYDGIGIPLSFHKARIKFLKDDLAED